MQQEQHVGAELVGFRLLADGPVKGGASGRGQAVHLLVGPAVLLMGPGLGQPLGQQPRERRVDRAEAGALEMRDRSFLRSEERRVGKEWVGTGRSRWSPDI